MLGALAQCDFHEGRRIDIDMKQIGDDAADVAQLVAGLLAREAEDFLHPAVEALVAALQLGQDGDAFAHSRELSIEPAVRDIGPRQLAPHLHQSLLGGRERRAVLVREDRPFGFDLLLTFELGGLDVAPLDQFRQTLATCLGPGIGLQ
jgi:hypothetical protein